MNPTEIQAQAFAALYDHFNRELFGGTLAPCLLNFSRKSGALGFFAPERWAEAADGSPIHEISINPSYLSERSAMETASTLVHEMCHLWQREHGDYPARGNYHNRQWGSKMEEVGLIPSSTGSEGGRRTGVRMSHYIAPGGAFEAAWNARPLTSSELFPYRCQESEGDRKRKAASVKSKTKYTCPGCETNVWAKPGLTCLRCGDCEADFEESDE